MLKSVTILDGAILIYITMQGRGRINLENVEQDRIENQVYSNRVKDQNLIRIGKLVYQRVVM